jgi:hypothetical protein
MKDDSLMPFLLLVGGILLSSMMIAIVALGYFIISLF